MKQELIIGATIMAGGIALIAGVLLIQYFS